MVKRLKRNFILVTMLSVILVLVILMAIVNGVNYYSQDEDAALILNILADNGGVFPSIPDDGDDVRVSEPPPKKPEQSVTGDSGDESPEETEQLSSSSETSVKETPPPGTPPQGEAPSGTPPPKPQDDDIGSAPLFSPGGQRPPGSSDSGSRSRGRRAELITIETPYEQRYFSVELDSTANPIMINTGNIAAVTTEDALEIAAKLMYAGKKSGYEGSYKYTSKATENGTLYVFLDRTRDLRSVREFLVISLLVSLGAAVSIFILVFIFSGIAIKPMAESYEKQKKFITNAGHEIKTPLAVISSCVDVMELEQGDSKWTKGIRGQVERLSGLTKNLVALARMDEGQTALEMTEVAFSDIAKEVLEPFEIPSEQKGIDFKTDIADNIMLKGNSDALSQLCSIMADNAVKYTPEDGEIIFTLAKKGRHIVFSSDNTAENIEKGNHDELFDRFHRGDSSRSSERPGYGIGMSMLRSIAAAHGAKTEAFSPDGKRLVVTVKF